jgi:hypothetical protein
MRQHCIFDCSMPTVWQFRQLLFFLFLCWINCERRRQWKQNNRCIRSKVGNINSKCYRFFTTASTKIRIENIVVLVGPTHFVVSTFFNNHPFFYQTSAIHYLSSAASRLSTFSENFTRNTALSFLDGKPT